MNTAVDISCVKVEKDLEAEQVATPVYGAASDANGWLQTQSENQFTEIDIGPVKIDPDGAERKVEEASIQLKKTRTKSQNKSAPSAVLANGRYQCPHCPRDFERADELDIHQQIHTNKLSYKCSYCPSSFSHKSIYTTHMYGHTGKFPHQCPDCPQGYMKYGDLMKHCRMHMTKDMNKCPLCPRNCVHTGKSFIQCPQCPRVFSKGFELEIHLQIHSDKLPYKCPHCPNSFAHKSNYISHICEHTGKFPYKCHRCPRGFMKRNDLIKHSCEHEVPDASNPRSTETEDVEQKSSTEINKPLLLKAQTRSSSRLKKSAQPIANNVPQEKAEVTRQEKPLGVSQEKTLDKAQQSKGENELMRTQKKPLVKRQNMPPLMTDEKSKVITRKTQVKSQEKEVVQENPNLKTVRLLGKAPEKPLTNGITTTSSTLTKSPSTNAKRRPIETKPPDQGEPYAKRRLVQTDSGRQTQGNAVRKQIQTKSPVISQVNGKRRPIPAQAGRLSQVNVERKSIPTQVGKQSQANLMSRPIQPESIVLPQTNTTRRPLTNEVGRLSQAIGERRLIQREASALSQPNAKLRPIHSQPATQLVAKISPRVRYNCIRCSMRFLTIPELEQHQRENCGNKNSNNAHTESGLFACEQCPKTFTQFYKLSVHKRIHSGERPYKCPYCRLIFEQSSALKGHLQQHSASFKCPYCPQTFVNGSNRRKHISLKHLQQVQKRCTELQDQPYKCAHCMRTFKQKVQFLEHEREHMGERLFECGHCGKAFKISRDLNQHMLTHKSDDIHTSEAASKSLQCQRSFKAKCPNCPEIFTQNSFCKAHRNEHEN